MKKLFFLCLCMIQIVIGQNKHALIVGIGNYPEQGGWGKISSIRDIQFIDSALKGQGFKDIMVLKDQEATKQGIVAAFEALISKTGQHSGDVVVIHISSHGEQIEDNNKDETDGLDESIVTYNAISPEVFDLQNPAPDFNTVLLEYLRDDEFGVFINRLRKKLGKHGDVIVFMDNCHSGTISRGLSKVRGGRRAFVSASFDRTKRNIKDTSGVFKEKADNDETNLATFVVISAARAEEQNVETTGDDNIPVGSLTYAVSKVLSSLDANITYRGLFAKIQAIMHSKVPGQHPVMEGNGLDRLLLGGAFISQKPYFEIDEIKNLHIKVKGGLFSGLTINAKISVYPSGTIDPLKVTPLAVGTVIRSSGFKSEIRMDRALALLPAEGWVFITSPAFNTGPVTLKIVSDMPGSNRKFADVEFISISNALKELAIKYEGIPDLLLIKGDGLDSIMIAGNGYLYKTIAKGNNYEEELKLAIQSYVQYKFLQTFSVKNEHVQLDVKLLPVKNLRFDTADGFTNNNRYEFYEKDTLVLWVKNKSQEKIYINILDMQPDGVINPVLPFKNKNIYPEDLFLLPGQTRVFSKYHLILYPPYGTEIFKVFASREQIDLESIATSKGVTGRGNLKAIEQIIKRSYTLGRRGQDMDNMETADGTTYDLLFEIKKR